jgi:ubiquinone biosynthesis protein COQ9
MIDSLTAAILPHVAFDGWSDRAFTAAAQDLNITPAEARAHAPRGARDLAIAWHRQGDRALAQALKTDLSHLRFREKVAHALWLRLDGLDREAVRRATALFALPQHAPDSARLIWETADTVWTALGDRSDDLNWYTKRAILSGVWSATVLFWLGDDSTDHQATRDFIDRRIANVMQIEEIKAKARAAPGLKGLMGLIDTLGAKVRAPMPGMWRDDLPGHWVDAAMRQARGD